MANFEFRNVHKYSAFWFSALYPFPKYHARVVGKSKFKPLIQKSEEIKTTWNTNKEKNKVK